MLKNIVIVNDFAYKEGGASSVAISSAIELSKYYNVFFFTSVEPIDERLLTSAVKVISINGKDILNDNNRIRAIINGLWNEKAKKIFEQFLKKMDNTETVIHFHTWTKSLSSSLYSVTSKYNFKVVVTLHDYFCFCPNGGFYNYKSRLACKFNPLTRHCLCTNCDSRNYIQKIWRCIRQYIFNHNFWKNNITFISISEFEEKILKCHLKNNCKIYRITDPVDISKCVIDKINQNNDYVYLGRLSPEKGVDLFCKAIDELNLHGVVLGDGYMLPELKRKYPKIKFVGWISNKDKDFFLRKAKCIVFPSLWFETFGLTIAEAKSFGIPCIVADNTAATEQIIDNKTGLVFKNGDLDSLKHALIKYESIDVLKLHRNIVENLDINAYSINSHISKIISLYKKILN